MSAVRDAIRARLVGDSTLMALCSTPTSVYHRKAPQTARLPLVIFDKRTGRRTYTFSPASKMRVETWAVRGVAFGRTADRAEEIAARIEAVMTDLAPAGLTCLDVRLESEVDFPEQVGKDLLHHAGGVYRIIVE